MNQFWQIMDIPTTSGVGFSPENVLLSLLLAFVLGQLLAWVYYFTHSGLSYSKTFVQSIVMVTLVVALIMAVIGNNITRAFGLMGALAIIRFRNVVKDTRDIIFIFSALVIGMASGSQRYAIAVMGTVAISLVVVYLYATSFGTHQPRNGFLRFSLTDRIGPDHPIMGILKRFCGSFSLISSQDAIDSSEIEYAYQLVVSNTKKNERLLDAVRIKRGLK